MSPQRLNSLPIDSATAVVGATLTMGSLLLELVAPVNVILACFFVASIVLNFCAGSFASFAEHRRAERVGKWFSAQKATYGVAKKFALSLFIPLAMILDGMSLAAGDFVGGSVGGSAAAIAALTPTTKALLVAMTGAQVIGAAQSLHFALGDDAIPGLATILKAVNSAQVDGEVPKRRITDPIIDAYAREERAA